MALLNRVAAILALVAMTGCGQDDPPVTATDTGVLKTQRESLEQAKQVEQLLQKAADQQSQKIEQVTQ